MQKKNLTFEFDPADKEKFHEGSLRQDWFERYPYLFSKSDLDQARNQNKQHFRNWFAAVRLHEETGLYVMMGYQKKKHQEKYKKFRSRVSDKVLNVLPSNNRPPGPDLFLYDPKDPKGNFFFVEVKGKSERLTDSQKLMIPDLEKAFGKPVHIVRVVKVGRPSSAGMPNEGKTIQRIRRQVRRGRLPRPFRGSDVNRVLGITFGGNFLPKHRIGNPGRETELFQRIDRGTYELSPYQQKLSESE
jgi:hypothetical protein